MRLIFRIMESSEGKIFLNSGLKVLPYSIIRVLVSLADQPEDRMRNIAIECLCEYGTLNLLAIRFPASVSYAGGLKVIFNAVFDAPADLLPPVIKTFMYLIDGFNTRRYIMPLLDVEVNFVNLADGDFTIYGCVYFI